ncbi:antitoxin Xre/MbcA/ParS toxin-binding domain-containing protein [Thiocapsa bogorovii]|uniref:antitoxin Xre/MbcA/ParS toxin-binding domain-containing protein n=1 Tax=Thiocapsa bogorovii TaxID=521689 RepID=UPI001E2F7F0C|nr:antitoxin Xre/MbcA/ParS toxin-binding domain-containing protein [Thiocapsa bogorovii]UHD16815.1 DUF2384 domain-containing protein [Thiocapsa bogorovii]
MSLPAELLNDVITDDGMLATDRLADRLRVTKTELALATGLSRDAVSRRSRLRSRQTQARLRDTVEIINRATGWAGSAGLAFAWFRNQPLHSFGDKTAEELVKTGRTEAVKAYLARIADGGYT